MIVADIYELYIAEVRNRGVANRECIVVSVKETVNLGQYGVILGFRGQNASAFPIRDNFFWFGDGLVHQGDWLFLFTGPGQARTNTIPNSERKSFSVHWGRQTTILQNQEIVPLLIRVDAVQVANFSDETPLLPGKPQT